MLWTTEESSSLFFIPYKTTERLAATAYIHDAQSTDWMIVVHGLFSTRNARLFQTVGKHAKINVLAYDMTACGESTGDPKAWSLGDYDGDVDELRHVVEFVRSKNQTVKVLMGHSRGANVILMYSYRFDDVDYYVSLSARMHSDTGLDSYFAPGDREKLERGEVEEVPCQKIAPDGVPRVIRRRDLELRLEIDMRKVRQVKHAKHVWLVHGTADPVIPVDQVDELAKCFENVPRTVFRLEDATHFMKSPHGKKGFEPLYEWLDKIVYPTIISRRHV